MAPLPTPDPDLPLPPIHLRVHPLTHKGAVHFLRVFGPQSANIIASHCRTIIAALYPTTSPRNDPSFPKIQSITIYVRPMDRIAYTTDGMIDPEAKETHLSANYIERCDFTEISGVLIHELVHVWQRNGLGSAPGGFIEGVADFVRLKSHLGARHWHKSKPGKDQKWDAGYERTAWFFEWIEDHWKGGKGWVKRVNMRLEKERWGEWVWEYAGAKNVDELWKGYLASFGSEEQAGRIGPAPAQPTHSI
ncbi:hypothetical protein BOTBODRAFT_38911 [Botryobasidium botryosum FD-172 SS1]|uniref:Plant basic secretory protein n=1 Tax=Botryobasidium botryosum (strain FD-172 SS1) TaxID=930990 RepID=A0A067LVW7_BOTB1|nr:hypothetical protein BOTBODRAFT_38911 [Botryobasidium botryosum FD-172 SS1]